MEEYKLAECILPELAWQKVLDNLTMKDDIVSFSQTCKLFRRLSHSKREIVLFDEVLPHLVEYLVPYVRRDNIFKCRSICKSWRDSVDKIYENFFSNSSVYQKRYENSNFIQLFKCYSNYIFANHRMVSCNINYEQFLTEMRTHPGNPFIGRGVRLELSYPNRSPSFEALEEFLQVFGKHIWTLHLTIGEEFEGSRNPEAGSKLPIILGWALALPNLKKLIFASSSTQIDVTQLIGLERELQPPSTLEIADFTYLHFPEICQIIFEKVKAQLKVLFVRELEIPSQFTWDNLKQLHLIMDVDPKYPKTDLDLLKIITLPNLELLAFGLKSYFDHSWEKNARTKAFQSILESLKTLPTSSPNLKTIRFYSTWLWEKGIYFSTDLDSNLQCTGNIKTLEIEEETLDYGIQRADFAFLKHFSNLENIHIIQTKNPRPTKKIMEKLCKDETVQVYKFLFTGEMYKSNIWQFLPSLKTFKYLNRLYQRSCYDRLQRMEN